MHPLHFRNEKPTHWQDECRSLGLLYIRGRVIYIQDTANAVEQSLSVVS